MSGRQKKDGRRKRGRRKRRRLRQGRERKNETEKHERETKSVRCMKGEKKERTGRSQKRDDVRKTKQE